MNAQQLEDRLERLAGALPDPSLATPAEVRSRVRSRRRRRRVMVAAAALPAVVAAVVLIVGLLPQGPRPPVITPVDEPAGGLELSQESLWTSPAVGDVAEAARVFANTVLGWDDPAVVLGTDQPGPVWVTIADHEDRMVGALFVPTADERHWQVQRVGRGFGNVTYDPVLVELVGPVPPGTTSADLFVGSDELTWKLRLEGDRAREGTVDLTAHGLPADGNLVSGLVVYRDAVGRTLGATGGQLDTHGGDVVTPEPITDREAVLEVDVGGTTRTMVVWRADGDTICIDLSGTSCIAAPTETQMMGPRLSSSSSGAGKPTVTCEYGAVHPEVATVEMHFTDGTVAEAEAGDASNAVGGRYYAHCWTGNQGRPAVVLLDEDGVSLHRDTP